MISRILKIFSILLLLLGILSIMVIKNISANKQEQIKQLELTLIEEQAKNDLYKIEWSRIISPINLKKISEMIITNDYTKYFVVMDKNDVQQKQEYFNDVINVVKPYSNSPAR
tara:strand:+ start:42 stop:380 length:339 start_codon:yes stop_codon:yes gene_type:complete